jgi:hypothetical protein
MQVLGGSSQDLLRLEELELMKEGSPDLNFTAL